jgi:hypothetical protein
MGISVSLGSGEFALLAVVVIATVLIALFVALFLSTIIGLGIVRLLYAGGSWCVKRIRESRPLNDMESSASVVRATRMASVRRSSLRWEPRL